MLASRHTEFTAHLARERARTAAKVAALGDMSEGAILKHADSERWAFVLPDLSGSGEWRMQYFDAHGFSGHALYASHKAILESAVAYGYTQRDDAALDRAQALPSFWRGAYYAELIPRFVAGELTFAQVNELMAEYDANQAAQA